MNVLLLASFLLSALVVAVAAIGLPWYLRKRLDVSWKWWGLGMAVFLIFQVVLRIPWVVETRSAMDQPRSATDPTRSVTDQAW